MAIKWLYAREAAEAAGVSYDVWRSYDKPKARTRARVPLPEADRRHPENGRKQWAAATVRSYRAARRRMAETAVPQKYRAQELHDRIWQARHTDGASYEEITKALDVSSRTVWRHLKGRCACKP